MATTATNTNSQVASAERIQELQSEIDGHKEKEAQDVCQTMCSVNFPLVLTPSAGRGRDTRVE